MSIDIAIADYKYWASALSRTNYNYTKRPMPTDGDLIAVIKKGQHPVEYYMRCLGDVRTEINNLYTIGKCNDSWKALNEKVLRFLRTDFKSHTDELVLNTQIVGDGGNPLRAPATIKDKSLLEVIEYFQGTNFTRNGESAATTQAETVKNSIANNAKTHYMEIRSVLLHNIEHSEEVAKKIGWASKEAEARMFQYKLRFKLAENGSYDQWYVTYGK